MNRRAASFAVMLIAAVTSPLPAQHLTLDHFGPEFSPGPSQASSVACPFCRELFMPWILQGQSFADHLITDRPDFTESSSVVGRRRLQIEGGYTFYLDDSAGVMSQDHVLPELLVRYGLSDTLELRVDWQGYIFSSQSGQAEWLPFDSSGGTGLSVGFKSQFADQQGCMPECGMIYRIDLPVGDPAVGSDRVGASLVGLYSWELTDRISVAGNTGGYFIAPAGDYFNCVTQSLSVSIGLTEQLGIYQEWFMLAFSDAEDSRPEHYCDGGVTYLITPNFQLDWRAGVGLSEAAADFFTGTGFAVRW